MYNGEEYVAKAIDSVMRQSYGDWELLLIDDGSTDQTKEVAQSYLGDARVRYFYKQNGGQGSARNMGIEKSSGRYLAFIDQDDLWDTDKLKKQVQILMGKNVDLVFSKVRCIDQDDEYLNRNLGHGDGLYNGFQAFFLLAGGTITIPNLSVVASKESVCKAGGFDEAEAVRYIEDYDLWYRIILAGYNIFGIGEVLGSYRIHTNQCTYSDPGSNLKMVSLIEKMSHRYPDKLKYFKLIIINRLRSYYRLHGQTRGAGDICEKTYFSCACVRDLKVFRYLSGLMGIDVYLKFSGLMTRRLKRYKNVIYELR